MASYKEEREQWVEEEMVRVMEERPNLTIREQKIMRSYLEKDFENVWQTQDYVYGQDEGEAPKGANW